MTHGRRSESGSRARLASVRPRSTRRIDRRRCPDPLGALLAELDRAGAGHIGNGDLLTSGTAARVAFAYQQAQRAARQAERAAQQANAPMSGGSPPEMKEQSRTPPAPMRNPGPGGPQPI